MLEGIAYSSVTSQYTWVRVPLPILLLLALVPGACQVCPPATKALVLAPDFHNAENAGRSFFAAMSCNDAGAEYKCLSEPLKDRYGATLDLYLLARPQIREEIGTTAGQAFRLKPLRVEQAEPGTLIWWGIGEREIVGLVMLPQYFYDVTESDGRRTGSILSQSPDELLQLQGRHLILDLSDSALRSLGGDPDISDFHLGTEWKIADFRSPKE
ncbi:MAG: hypothetical protein COA70_13605 [Planctomycetota bacterium]|nr:MAG: hypothetical protein COA70_13605 [Planctomycetota bacterium]